MTGFLVDDAARRFRQQRFSGPVVFRSGGTLGVHALWVALM
jgi:hypothetical protein